MLFFLCAAAFFGAVRYSGVINNNVTGSVGGNDMIAVYANNHRFRAEIADTPKKRELGLGNRPSLCEHCAMLFLFSYPGNHAFWMKGMRFDLDIAWLREHRVVHVAKNASHLNLDAIQPNEDSDAVLELNAGLAEKYGIEKNTIVAW